MSSFEVRRAVLEDAPGIAAVHVGSWRETYTRLVEPGELDALSVERRTARWTTTLTESHDVWVAEVDGVIVGFAMTSPAPDGSPGPIVLDSIYVFGAHHGSGAGQALLDAALGDSPAVLFVAADNPRATRFYERNGFAFDGESESYPLVRTPITSLRMVR